MAENAQPNRRRRRASAAIQRSKAKLPWGPWVFGAGAGPKAEGWKAGVRYSATNDRYGVLVRPVKSAWGSMIHLAILCQRGEPSAADFRRIVDEIVTAGATFCRFYPVETELGGPPWFHVYVLTNAPPPFPV
jgi:hypothetical protein